MSISADMISSWKTFPLPRGSSRGLVVFSSLALVVLAAAAALVLVQGIDRQLRDVLGTYEVRNHARELSIALSEAESSQAVYLLTQDPAYIDPFRRASSAIETRLLSLLAEAGDDPEQDSRVRSIASEIRTEAAEMARLVQEAESTATHDANRAVGSGQTMGAVRATLDQFVAEENQKLLERNRAIDTSRRWLVVALIAALTGAVMLGYTLLSRTQQQVTDLSRQSHLLFSEKELLETIVQERTQALDEARIHAERERLRVEALLQDTNHRIGNSLATVSSLLGLQMIRTTSEEVREALDAARSRVHAIASAHRRLRLGSDHETASADQFLEAVVEDIQQTASGVGEVELISHIDPIVIGSRDATTLGILVGELVTNALKHAFPDDRPGRVVVCLSRNEAGVPVLSVQDNGVGMASTEDPDGQGLGSVIVKQLSGQFGGKPVYEPASGEGLRVSIPLPTIEGVPSSSA